jgi:hypothetical protein
MDDRAYLVQAVEKARETMHQNLGGPFGALLVDHLGEVFVDSNTVLGSNDPTAHAEVNVIRQACKKKGTHDLSGCILYTTCYPCPMCLSACIWANRTPKPSDSAMISSIGTSEQDAVMLPSLRCIQAIDKPAFPSLKSMPPWRKNSIDPKAALYCSS